MNHEKQYIYNLAADPDIDYFGAEELVEIEKLGDIDWKCVAKCVLDFGICIVKGGSKKECGLKYAKCLLDCKKNDKDR